MGLRAGAAVLLVGAGCGAALTAWPSGAAAEHDPDRLQLEIVTAVASDYMYRGVSLSERRPTAHASIDVQKNGFYGDVQFASVSLPNDPAVEITLAGGYRWKLAGIKFDLGGAAVVGTLTATFDIPDKD